MRIFSFFNWFLHDILEHLIEIREQGFNTIQISCVQSLKNEKLYDWWNCYDIKNYEIGNHFGSKSDLVILCEMANLIGMKVFVEIVPQIYDYSELNKSGEITANLLGVGKEYSITQNQETKLFNLINELIDCGVKGICLNQKKIKLFDDNKLFFSKISEVLMKQDVLFYSYYLNLAEQGKEVYLQYLRAVTCYSYNLTETDIKYVESPYSYFNLNFGITSFLSSRQITEKYISLCQNYNDTIYYSRPFDNEWRSSDIKVANQCVNKIYTKNHK